ncbi:unnamed protein product, partial [Phaeothamnion confervicola]
VLNALRKPAHQPRITLRKLSHQKGGTEMIDTGAATGSNRTAVRRRPIVLLQLPPLTGPVLIVAPGAESVLGRSTTCALVVNHISVSRRHAALAVDGPHLRVTDLGSRNGTFAGEDRVTGTALAAPGTRVRFGSLDFFVAGHEARVPEPDSDMGTDAPSRQRLSPPGAPAPEPLSEAQRRVFDLLVTGLSEKRIAARLGISRCTAHNHISAIYRALGVHSRSELLVHALGGRAGT